MLILLFGAGIVLKWIILPTFQRNILPIRAEVNPDDVTPTEK
jgi:hypothetical protein